MSKKIMGVTVGTPISPKVIEKEIKPIKTVNGIEPDANGNVNIDGGSAELPIFDLVALGAKPIEIGKGQTLNVDTTEIMAALDKGLVTFVLEIVRDSGTFRYYVTPIMQRTGAFYHCYYINKGTGIIETISVVVTTGMMIVGASQDAIGGGDITVDSELSLESENPVQNKVIKAAFDSTNRSVSSIFQRQEEMGNHLDSLQNQVDNMGGGGSGGVSSWNDLTDKPFDDNVTTIFDGVLQDTQSSDTWMGEPSAEDTSDAALVVGQTYTYTWDGKEYTSVCFTLEGMNCIGNNAPVSGVDNGHPVLIFRHPTKWEAIVINNRNDTDGTYSLKITTAIKQLDNKYLEPFERQVGDVIEFLPSYTAANVFNSGLSAYNIVVSTDEATYNAFLENTKPMVIVYDGVEYICEVHTLQGTKYLGNGVSLGGAGNNEPFAIMCRMSNTGSGNAYYWLVVSTVDTASTEHTVRVYQRTPDKWLLKEQYLPDGIGGTVAQPVSIDLSGLDTSGTIVETYADGTTKTTTMEFDENGNPIKITDGDGNVTTLTW